MVVLFSSRTFCVNSSLNQLAATLTLDLVVEPVDLQLIRVALLLTLALTLAYLSILLLAEGLKVSLEFVLLLLVLGASGIELGVEGSLGLEETGLVLVRKVGHLLVVVGSDLRKFLGTLRCYLRELRVVVGSCSRLLPLVLLLLLR